MTGKAILIEASLNRCGFLTESDVATVASDPTTRLTPLLIRCGNGRFITPAQNAAHFIKAIETSGLDYVRDVSIPAGDGSVARSR